MDKGEESQHFLKSGLMPAYILLDGLKAGLTDHVFNFAGVLSGGFFADTDRLKPAGEKFMLFVNRFGNRFARFGQVDKAGISNPNMLL